MKNAILYFAFGSNCNYKRMQKRCQGAIPLGVAKLSNYRLTERLYADIDYSVGDCVHGVLYMITEEHLRSLDRYEGAPLVYRRYYVEVNFKGEIYPALVYEMTEPTKAKRNGIAYPEEYRKTCSDGADKYKIPNQFKRKKSPWKMF